jgi:hypothetical protein
LAPAAILLPVTALVNLTLGIGTWLLCMRIMAVRRGDLGGTAVWLAYETKGLLIGESANMQVVDDIRETALQMGEVLHVN